MEIIITGSLGHISRPLTETLVEQGHQVTVISSNQEKQTEISALGAIPAIGSLEDVDFLVNTFTGANAVYTMVPPNNYFDHSLDLLAYYRRLGHNYARAIENSGIKSVVNLSTFGAHLEQGSGILLGAHDVEHILNELPATIAITHIRPVSFYYNLYGYLDMIKKEGVISANYGGENQIPWVSPVDIAAAIAQEIATPLTGRKVRYVASEELSGNEVAGILGAAIGKPELKWNVISAAQAQSGLEASGMHSGIATGLVEMYGSLHSGVLAADYFLHKPAVMGKVKMTDFAKEFAIVFNQN